MIKMRRTFLCLSVVTIIWLCNAGIALGQQTSTKNVNLNDLSFFKHPGESWKIVGNVTADLKKTNEFNTSKGTGVLVNLPTKKISGTDLLSNEEYGDLNLELDYMMAQGSNSGIYLQGQYELQLEDTWAGKIAKASNNGGIYERWDNNKPDGLKGYEGHAPRQNVSKAPGLWQHLKISFLAPRFDTDGKKIANARFLSVELNGVLIHQNLELSGPTRGALSGIEKASGPLRLQGDHGAVAFKNIQIAAKPIAKPVNSAAGKPLTTKIAEPKKAPADPIFVDAPVNTVLRSFMDIDTFRVVHAVSVGSPNNLHYTYDLDKGSVIQIWRGNFLDVTPMWNGRGNGSSRPMGAVQHFGKPTLTLAKLSGPQVAWINDTTGTNFKINGYELDDQDRPTFSYSFFGTLVKDASVVIEEGKGISRTITLTNPSDNLYVRLAEASNIEELNGTYLIDNQSYYLRINSSDEKPVIREFNGRKELIAPIKSRLSYSILF